MATICALLKESHLPDSPNARLDAELLLTAVLDKPRTFLHTWPERLVEREPKERFARLLERRRRGEPIAYILGRQGFWQLDLEVSPHTLIPRPETELLVELALGLPLMDNIQALDLGTGSGAIALALAHERRQWNIIGVDRISAAVQLAERNRCRLLLNNVTFCKSDWFTALDGHRYHLIISNPPYIAEGDQHLAQGDVRFEPLSALTSGPEGLDAIRWIINNAPNYLYSGGWLLFEHGYDQAAVARVLLQGRGFSHIHSQRDLRGHERVTLGCWVC